MCNPMSWQTCRSGRQAYSCINIYMHTHAHTAFSPRYQCTVLVAGPGAAVSQPPSGTKVELRILTVHTLLCLGPAKLQCILPMRSWGGGGVQVPRYWSLSLGARGQSAGPPAVYRNESHRRARDHTAAAHRAQSKSAAARSFFLARITIRPVCLTTPSIRNYSL